ncbi:hypothetical protein MMC16_002330 [Acarospora aff. strigata]|nr:hypothetical protein [Acarospora aff. strigata]
MCDDEGTKVCTGCNSSRYCSSECREADWSTHKLLCASFKDFATPPEKDMKRAIFFPTESKSPRFVWVPCSLNRAERREVIGTTPLLANFENETHVLADWLLLQRNAVRQRGLRHTVALLFRQAFLLDGLMTNWSAREATKGLMGKNWSGPIFAFRQPGLTDEPGYYDHMDMVDFRDVVDHFTSFGNEAVLSRAMWVGGKATGVKIACQGDMAVLGSEKFQSISIPRQHPVWRTPLTTDLSRLIDFPILTPRCTPDPAWKNNESITQRFLNYPATSLHFITDKTNPGWGSAPISWQDSVGSVLVVRPGWKPLSPLHLEAFCAFCQHKVGPLLQDHIGSETERENALEEITANRFGEFFESYRASMAESSREWRTVRSPYDV